MDNMLYRVDAASGTRELLARDLDGIVTYHAGEWIYTTKEFAGKVIRVTSSAGKHTFNTSGLSEIHALVPLDTAVYALDGAANLYRLSDQPPELLRRRVHNIAGDSHLLLICQLDGTFEAIHDSTTIFHRRCPRVSSPETISVFMNNYAALTESGDLILSRNGQSVSIHTDIHGEYEIALSATGLVAIADYTHDGKSWFVRPGLARLEEGPKHSATLLTVTTSGQFAAWAYTDGTVMAFDPTTDTTWELVGHPNGVSYITIIDQERTLVSLSSNELRTWHLNPLPATTISQMPCSTFNFLQSPDGRYVGLDCSDGSVWVWQRNSDMLRQLHHHSDLSFGVQWLDDMLCSGGWDGKVMCSTTDAKTHRIFTPNAGKVVWLASGPKHDFLIVATADGRIWKVDGQLHELYSQQAVPYRVEVAQDDSTVASCGLDGSIAIFDVGSNRIRSRSNGHSGAIRSLMWYRGALWTSGADHWLRQWEWNGSLGLREAFQASAPLRLTVAFRDGWVTNAAEGELLIGQGSSVSFRVELDRRIDNIDVSADGRYVAASILGEAVIVDVKEHRLATVAIDSTPTGGMKFVDLNVVAVSTINALKIIRISELDYTQF
jgi:WD40 repeat protein